MLAQKEITQKISCPRKEVNDDLRGLGNSLGVKNFVVGMLSGFKDLELKYEG